MRHILPDDAFRQRGDVAAAMAAAPRQRRRDASGHRRAGAFLSRRPGRAGHPRRGRRRPSIPRPSIRPRSSTSSPRCSGIARCRGDGRGAPHGRRLRRQGNPGGALRRRSPRSLRARPAARPRSASTATTTWSMTGKRHDFVVDYDVGFDDDGRHRRRRHRPRLALRLLRRPVRRGQRPRDVPRRQRLLSWQTPHHRRRRCSTNTVSNTAFRGFGGPQGMMAIERVDRRHRLRPRQGSARCPQGQSLRRRPQRHALRPDGRGQHHRPS